MVPSMLLVLDGYSEIGAHIGSNLCYLICSWLMIRSREVTNRIFVILKDGFSIHTCATYSELPYNIVTLLPSSKRIFNLNLLRKQNPPCFCLFCFWLFSSPEVCNRIQENLIFKKWMISFFTNKETSEY